MRTLLTVLIVGGVACAETKVDGPVVLLIGPPGSGKSTQAKPAARVLGVPIVRWTTSSKRIQPF